MLVSYQSIMAYEKEKTMKTQFEITQNFTYKDGTSGGILHTVVNSRKAVVTQLEANYQWLRAHGHTPGEVIVSVFKREVKNG